MTLRDRLVGIIHFVAQVSMVSTLIFSFDFLFKPEMGVTRGVAILTGVVTGLLWAARFAFRSEREKKESRAW